MTHSHQAELPLGPPAAEPEEEDLLALLSAGSLRQFQLSPTVLATAAEQQDLLGSSELSVSTNLDDDPTLRGFHMALLDHCLALLRPTDESLYSDPAVAAAADQLLSVLAWFARAPAFRRLLARLARRLRFADRARLCRLLERVGHSCPGALDMAQRLVRIGLARMQARLLWLLLTGASASRLAPCLARCRFLLRRTGINGGRNGLLRHYRLPSAASKAEQQQVWRRCLLRYLLAALPTTASDLPPRLVARCLLAGGLTGYLRRLAAFSPHWPKGESDGDKSMAAVAAARLAADVWAASPGVLCDAVGRLSVVDRRRLRDR